MSKALQEFTRISRYSRYRPEKKRRETWEEQVNRVFDQMHAVKYADVLDDIREEYEFAKKAVLEKKVLGSQRALQFGGPAILNKHARMYNCIASFCSFPRMFQETMWLLLCGCGVGFSVQKHHVDQLPEIAPIQEDQKTTLIVVEDSIEGWADSLGALLSSYFVENQPFPKYAGKDLVFDFSQIRPKGSPISDMGGSAPGASPLKKALGLIKKILDDCIEREQKKLRPIDAYDIICHASDAVLAGGIRRCIGKGSLVLTQEGSFKPIEEIKVGDFVSTNNGWKPVTNTFVQGEQKTLQIIHSEGKLICTPNHRVAVLIDMQGNFEWKEAGKLNPGDRLLYIEPDIEDGENKLPEFKYKKPPKSTTCKDIVIPELDEEMAWLLGNIQGDGCISLSSKQGQVKVSVEPGNMEQAEFVQDQLQRFGVNTRIRSSDGCINIFAKSKQLAKYFDTWLKKANTPLKIPHCILHGTREVKFAFIQGLMDADGCVKGTHNCVVTSIYPNYVREIQNLLYSLGIVSRIQNYYRKLRSENHHKEYNLSIILNCDRKKFNEGCSLGWKQFRLKKLSGAQNSIPMEFFKRIPTKDRPAYWAKSFSYRSKNIPLESWRRLEHGVFVPMEVTEIKEHKIVETFDIEVEGNHNFICEGVLVHNSALISVFSPDDEEMVKAKTGNWFIDNPQRGRTNNSALLIRNETKKEDFVRIMESVKNFGEPGFVWSDNTEVVYNPCCVPGDTWVLTSEGSKQVKDLIGVPFTAIVDGEPNECKTGFFKSGSKQVHKLITNGGLELRATSDHRIMTNVGWCELGNLQIGMNIRLANPSKEEKYDTVKEIIKGETCDVYDCTVDGVHAFDANGIYVHNCEISLYPVDEKTGEVGFQACNLCEINMKDMKTPEEFYDACRAGAILGTLQAGYTQFDYLSEASQRIIEREALLGVSMTGMCDNPKIAFNPEVLRKGANIVKEVNKQLAKKIGINPSARTTCVKPAGSTSCILGTSSGIHPAHAKRYFRRVQINKLEKPGKFFAKHNPDAVEESVWSANKTDNVATFLCETPPDAFTKTDVDAVQLLKYVKIVQENWVQEGRDVDLCVQSYLQHNVSNTISVREDEWSQVTDFIYEHRENFAGVSLLPASGDKIYKQAPFQAVYTPEELVKMYGDGAIFSSGVIIHALQAFDNDLFDACDAVLGMGKPLDVPDFKNQDLELESQIDVLKNLMDKRLFIERAKKFARRYFDGDVRKMTYCLKDVDSWKKWCDLKRTYVDVPWIEFKEKKNNVKISQTVACSGGACELVRM